MSRQGGSTFSNTFLWLWSIIPVLFITLCNSYPSLYFTSIQVEQIDTKIKQIAPLKLKIYNIMWRHSDNFCENDADL